MKQKIISTVSFFMFIPFVIVAFIVYGAVVSGAIGQGIAFGLVGWCLSCLVTGGWFVLVEIADNSRKQTAILQKILDNQNNSH